MTTPLALFNIRTQIEGSLLGLDCTEAGSPIGSYTPYLMGKGFRGLRLFPVGKDSLQGNDYKIAAPITHNEFFDDFMGSGINTFWNLVKGSDGSTGNAIHAAVGGTQRLTTGAGSTHTMAVNGSQITSPLDFLVSNGGLRFESRLGKISALTSQSICFGLVDVATLSAPFTISGTTFTATSTNAVAFVEDSAATGAAAKLNAVAINAGGSVQSVNIGIDVDTAAFHTYRIEVDKLGNALYFIDGVQVASILLAVATTAVLCTSVGIFSNATSASQTLDIDYILGQQTRV